MLKVLVILLLTFYVSLELFKNNESTDLIDPSTNFNNRYNCKYSQLSCGCYSKYGGCNVQCSPSVAYMIFNQTSCPSLPNHFLSGFTHV